MITVTDVKGTANGGLFSLMGKSLDTKPTDKLLGMAIDNGSSFFEIDTHKIYFFDFDAKEWS